MDIKSKKTKGALCQAWQRAPLAYIRIKYKEIVNTERAVVISRVAEIIVSSNLNFSAITKVVTAVGIALRNADILTKGKGWLKSLKSQKTNIGKINNFKIVGTI